jgi:hypothetical protein
VERTLDIWIGRVQLAIHQETVSIHVSLMDFAYWVRLSI